MNPANDTPEELAQSEEPAEIQEPHPFAEMRDNGLLWWINASLFHPRGYALAFHYDGHDDNLGPAVGWSILGDGAERWIFSETPEMEAVLDELFHRVKELMP